MERLLVSVPDADLGERLVGLGAPAEVILWPMQGPAPVVQIDVVVPPYVRQVDSLSWLAGLRTRLVQSQSIGYDGVAAALPPGHVFANAASVHETSTAELALGLILASQRGLDGFVRAAGEGRWAPAWRPSLADRRVLLVGYGGVARAIEARLAPFEVSVTRVARHARQEETGVVHALADLPGLLGEADVVVVAVPLTPETERLVDADFLGRMRDGSLLVNVARGRVADTEALLSVARSGRLRLALDVLDPEPLPAGHPLFGLRNVLISPHVGGMSSAMAPRMARLLADQVNRLLTGEPVRNVVLRS